MFNKEKAWRPVFELYTYLKDYCLKKDIGDIIFKESKYPYLVDWSKNVYEIEMEKDGVSKKVTLENLFKHKYWNETLTWSDMYWLLVEMQKLSILKGLESKFDEGPGVDFAIKHNGTKIRVNFWLSLWNIEVVSRVLPSWDAMTLEQLWLVSEENQVYKTITSNKEWIILVVWPTGSGKSTTLVSMVNEINMNSARRILTFEDPVEFEHRDKMSTISQKEVGVDVKDYKHGLKLALRQKPHIVVVWEIRDWEVMELWMEFASTGHMVMSTFHAKTVTQTLSRIEKFFPESEREWVLSDLSEMVLWIFVQRLVPKKWGGKILLREMMVATQSIKKAIAKRDWVMVNGLMKAGRGEWMIDCDWALLELYEKNLIDENTLFWYALDKKWAESVTWISY